MAQLVEIDRESDLVYKATRCSKIPKKYLNDFFAELVAQRGVRLAWAFIEEGNGILAEAFDWKASVKGNDFWNDLENKLLSKAGIVVESKSIEDECCKKINNIKDQRNEELSAIHSDMRKLLEILKQV